MAPDQALDHVPAGTSCPAQVMETVCWVCVTGALHLPPEGLEHKHQVLGSRDVRTDTVTAGRRPGLDIQLASSAGPQLAWRLPAQGPPPPNGQRCSLQLQPTDAPQQAHLTRLLPSGKK